MTALVCHIREDIRDHSTKLRAPTAAEMRPRKCPSCGCWSPREGPHVLVGHGVYRRVLRLEGGEAITVRVQRFICTLCSKTTSVLPSDIAPRRRYGATAIVLALVQHLLRRRSAGWVKQQVTPSDGPNRGWKTLGRWKRTILVDLWPSFAPQLGFTHPKETSDLSELKTRLARLLALHSAHAGSSTAQLHKVALSLTIGKGPSGDPPERWFHSRSSRLSHPLPLRRSPKGHPTRNVPGLAEMGKAALAHSRRRLPSPMSGGHACRASGLGAEPQRSPAMILASSTGARVAPQGLGTLGSRDLVSPALLPVESHTPGPRVQPAAMPLKTSGSGAEPQRKLPSTLDQSAADGLDYCDA